MEKLEDLLKKRISDNGPVSVAQYMAECLGHPKHGYYMSKIPFGVKGDFTTAPEISQMFGEMIGMWIANQWQDMGKPTPLQLVELGPGRGTLMADILRVLNIVPDLKAQLSVCMVEMSQVLQHEQKNALANEDVKITWHKSVADIPSKQTIFIANEFFDALPIHQFEMTDNGWMERMVTISDGKLSYCLSEPSNALFMCENSLRDSAISGDLLECSPVSINIMGEINKHISDHGGCGLIIDYGYIKAALGDSFQAVKNHATCSPLSTPGEADLTAHVNFEMLKKSAQEMGLTCSGPTTQGRFLKQLYIDKRAEKLCKNASPQQQKEINSALNRLTNEKEMGNLFKVLAITLANQTRPIGFE